MTEQIMIVFGVLAGAVELFASGRVRPDVVAILVVLALNFSGVLTIQEVVAGFGQPVVDLIAAVSIVGEGLIATGVAHQNRKGGRASAASKHAQRLLIAALSYIVNSKKCDYINRHRCYVARTVVRGAQYPSPCSLPQRSIGFPQRLP
jgi:hypothetical protein